MTLFRLFVGFGVLVVIALFTALIAPYFVDWTAYKRDFEEQASRIVGQPVTVGGEAEVRLLPLPSLAFSDLSVGTNRDDSPMLTVERFSANVELMPFLSGEIRIVDMQLDRPRFNIEVDENGAIAWTNRQQLLVDPDQVRLDRLTVRDGAFRLSGLAGRRSIEGDSINADLSANSLYGPWRIEGSGNVGGMDTDFRISTGTYSAGEPVRVRLTTSTSAFPYTISADGQAGLSDDVLVWSGDFESTPLDEASLASNATPPLPVRVSGSFRLTPSALDIAEYRGEVGNPEDPFVVTGKGEITYRNEVGFQLEIDGRQVNVERIARMQGEEVEETTTLETRIAVLRRIVDLVPVPGIDGRVSLEIPAIIAGDTYIREVSAVLRPRNSGWEVTRLITLLPGNTRLEAQGRLGRGEDFGFTGNVLIASRQPSGFAAWAVGRVDPSIRRLNVAGLSGNMTLTPNQLGVDQLELRLNGDVLTGSLQRLTPVSGSGDAKPAIIADLRGDSVALEKLRAVSALAFGSSGDQLDSLAFTHDLDINLKADRFEGLGITATGLDTQFQYNDGSLSIVRFNMQDVFGVSVSSRGTIADLLGDAEGNLALSVSADNLARAADFALQYFPEQPVLEAFAADPVLSANTQLEMEIDSRAGGGSGSDRQGSNSDGGKANSANGGARSRIVARGESGGTAISIRSGLKGRLADTRRLWLDFSGEFSNRDPSVLAAQLGARSFGFTDLYNSLEGPFEVSLEAVGEHQEGWSTLINGSLPGTVFSAKGLIATNEGGLQPRQFAVTAGSDDIVPVLGSFGILLPGLNVVTGDSAPLSLEARFDHGEAGEIGINLDRGSIGGNSFSGALTISGQGEQGPLRVDGALSLDHLEAGLLAAGLAGFEPSLVSLGGFSSEDSVVFSGPSLRNVTGKLLVSAGEVGFPSGEQAMNAAFTLTQTAATSEISDLTMTMLGGRVDAAGVLGTVDGAANLSGQISARDVSLAALSRALGLPEVVEGVGSVSTSLEATGKSPEAFAGSLSGSGVLEFENAKLEGVRLSGLETIFKAADQEEFEINGDSVAPLVQETFLGGSIEVGEGSAPFTIRNGDLLMRNIVLGSTPDGALAPVTADLVFDPAAGSQEASLTIVPDPGKEAVEGGTPEITFNWRRDPAGYELQTDTGGMEGFLSIRAFEAEQRKVEMLQAAILEKQRLRRDLLNSGERGRWLQAKRLAEIRRIEEERKAAEEAARLEAERLEAERLEAERRAREEAERKAAEEEAARQAAEEERRRLEAEAAAEAERQRQAELEAQRRAEEEAARRAAAEEEKKRKRQARETEAKQGVTVVPLDPPSGANGVQGEAASGERIKPAAPANLFENLEKLLLPKPFE